MSKSTTYGARVSAGILTRTTPEFRRDRASKAARARTDPDRLIAALADRAPSLTDEQRDRLAAILSGGGRDAA